MDPVLVWFIAGLVLILLEFLVPGVILVFFGVAAWVVTVLAWSGIVTDTSSQLMVFIVASLVLLFGLRRFVKSWFVGDTQSDNQDFLEEFIGHEVRVLADIPGGLAAGKVELKGAEWQARAECSIAKGSIARVLSRDGLVLLVQPAQ